MHRPYHQSRRRRVPVALITAADGVCHPTPAALIISRQRRRSIYPHRGRADRRRRARADHGHLVSGFD